MPCDNGYIAGARCKIQKSGLLISYGPCPLLHFHSKYISQCAPSKCLAILPKIYLFLGLSFWNMLNLRSNTHTNIWIIQEMSEWDSTENELLGLFFGYSQAPVLFFYASSITSSLSSTLQNMKYNIAFFSLTASDIVMWI